MIVTLAVLLGLSIVTLAGTVAALVWLFHVEHSDTTLRERHYVNAIIAGRATGPISETRAMAELTKVVGGTVEADDPARDPRHRRSLLSRVDRDAERELVAAGAVDGQGQPIHPVGFDD